MLPYWVQSSLGRFGVVGEEPPGYLKPRKIPVRVEPKTYFANERTFLSWIQMAVTMGTLSSALLGLAGIQQGGGEEGEDGKTNWYVSTMTLMALPLSIFMAAYALNTYYARLVMLRKKEVGSCLPSSVPCQALGASERQR